MSPAAPSKLDGVACPLCNGTGRHANFGIDDSEPCSRCDGSGRIRPEAPSDVDLAEIERLVDVYVEVIGEARTASEHADEEWVPNASRAQRRRESVDAEDARDTARDALLSAIATLAPPGPSGVPGDLTVGAALLDPRFKTREIVVEYREVFPPGEDDDGPVEGEWFQLRAVVDDGITYAERRQWYSTGHKWFRWKEVKGGGVGVYSIDDLASPCVVIPLADADRDPTTRAPHAAGDGVSESGGGGDVQR